MVSKRGVREDAASTSSGTAKKPKSSVPFAELDLAVLQAARENDLEALQRLIADVENNQLNLLRYRGMTPLVEAAKSGHLEVVRILVERGCDVNNSSQCGDTMETALMVAAEEGHSSLVDYLLLHNAELMDGSNSGVNYSPLQLAAASGHLPVVQRLLEAGANCDYKVGSETALMRAAKKGHVEVVDCLLAAGSSHMVAYHSGFHDAFLGFPLCESSVLCAAAAEGHTQVVQRVYQHAVQQLGGVQLSADVLSDNLHQLLVMRTPLMAASEHGHLSTVQLLLELQSQVDRECRHPEDGTVVPLEQAAKYGHEEVVRALLEAGASVRLDMAVTKAAKRRHWSVVGLIIQHFAESNPTECRPLRQVALAAAIAMGAEDAIASIFESDPRVGEGAEKSLILNAALYSTAVLQQLMKAGAQYEAEAIRQALQEAALNKKFDGVESMLTCGIPCHRVADPLVIVQVAKHASHLLNPMLKAGLNLNVTDDQHRSAASICFKRRDYSTMELLMNQGAHTRNMSAATIMEAAMMPMKFLTKILCAGANPAVADYRGEIAFVLARNAKHKGVHTNVHNRFMRAAKEDPLIANQLLIGCCSQPLKLACELRDLLQLEGVDGNFRHPVTGATPIVTLVLANQELNEITGRCLDIIKELLSAKHADLNLHTSCDKGLSPLLAAASVTATRTGLQDFVSQLISLGARVNATDNNACTALMYCAMLPSNKRKQRLALRVATVLLDKGAKMELPRRDGKTVLMVAAERGYTEMVRLLIQRGADVNQSVARSDPRGQLGAGNELTKAQGQGGSQRRLEQEMAREELQGAGRVACEETSSAQATVGAEGGGSGVAVADDVEFSVIPGTSPLMIASENNSLECARLLVQGGAHVNAVDARGGTALLGACQRNWHAMVDVLIKAGAHANCKDMNGWTPLMHAAKLGFNNTCMRLKIGGASGSTTSPDGRTAADIATQYGHQKLALLIRERPPRTA